MNLKMKNKNSHNDNSISREDIRIYNSSKDESIKHAIEKKALESDFEIDALEGWASTSTGIDILKKSDKRFTSSNLFWLPISIITIGIIVFVFLLPKNKENSTQSDNKTDILTKENRIKVIEKTDVIIPDKIEILKVIPRNKQIQVKTIQYDFKEKIEMNKNSDIVEIEKLPIKTIEKNSDKNVIVKKQYQAKEIYLNELKLVDYREYRSKPMIESKQLITSGTTANKENTNSNVEDSDWRKIEIPYIQYIDKTSAFLSKEEYKKALTRLESILEVYPNDVNAHFYAGICYFNLKQNSKAIQHFENCLNSEFSNFNEEAEWYLAKSYEQAGDIEKANKIRTDIKSKGGYYSKFLKEFN